jgi:hypothetical protein
MGRCGRRNGCGGALKEAQTHKREYRHLCDISRFILISVWVVGKITSVVFANL